MLRGGIGNTRNVDRILAVAALLAAFSQVGLGARFSPSGEQQGAALPVSSAILAAVLLVLVVRMRGRVVPLLSRWQTAFMVLVSTGILGLSRPQAQGGIKELVQLAEFVVVAPWVFKTLAESISRDFLRSVMGWAGFALLLLGITPLPACGVMRLSAVKYAAFVLLAWPAMLAVLRNTGGKVRFAVLAASGLLVGVTFGHGGLLLAWLVVTALALSRRFRLLSVPESALCAIPAVALSLMPVFHAVSPWQALNPHFDGQHLKRSAIEVRAAWQAPVKYPLGGGLGRYKPTINQLRQYGARVPHPDDRKVPTDGNCQYLATLVEAGFAAAVALLALFLGSARTALKTVPPGEKERAPKPAVDALSLVGCILASLFCVTMSRGTGLWVGAFLGLAGYGAHPVPARKAWLRAAAVGTTGGVTVLLMLACNPRPDPHTGESRLNVVVRRLLTGTAAKPGAKPRVIVLEDSTGAGHPAGTIRVEAEDGATVVAPFVVVPANDASGNRALMLPDDAAKGDGQAAYSINVPVGGAYVVFARVLWKDGCGNSVRFDLGSATCVLADDVFGEWHTLRGKRRIELPAGPVSVVIRGLENGISVDYWGLLRVDAP